MENQQCYTTSRYFFKKTMVEQDEKSQATNGAHPTALQPLQPIATDLFSLIVVDTLIVRYGSLKLLDEKINDHQ